LDGQQVLATVSGVTTVYINDYYKWTSAGNTKYYFANGQRVVDRVCVPQRAPRAG
jgi:hypothetical protein